MKYIGTMLIIVILVLLSTCICKGEYNPICKVPRESFSISKKRSDEQDLELLVKILVEYNSQFSKGPEYDNDGKYKFKTDKTLYITCGPKKKTKNLTLHWLLRQNPVYDGFETGHYQDNAEGSLRLKIQPDRDDNGLILTCRALGSCGDTNNISITLDLPSATSGLKPDTRAMNHQYINRGESLQNNATCNSTVRFGPATTAEFSNHPPIPFFTNQTIIRRFEQEDNGTIVSCVNLGLIKSFGKHVQSYERRKSTTILYLKPDSEISTWNVDITAKRKDLKSSPNAVAIASGIAGIFGAILIILMLVTLVMWFRKKYGDFHNAADEVIYAEIDERPPLPPPRKEKPCDKTMDCLVLKQQPPLVDEPIYCQININNNN